MDKITITYPQMADLDPVVLGRQKTAIDVAVAERWPTGKPKPPKKDPKENLNEGDLWQETVPNLHTEKAERI